MYNYILFILNFHYRRSGSYETTERLGGVRLRDTEDAGRMEAGVRNDKVPKGRGRSSSDQMTAPPFPATVVCSEALW